MLGVLGLACLVPMLMAPESLAGAVRDGPKKRFKQIKWPEDQKPEGFVAAVSLAELAPASAEIILLMAPPRAKPRKHVQLKSPADACHHLTRHLGMAAAPTYVAAHRGRPKTHYVFSGGTNARPVDDFSSGVVLAEDGRMTFYELDWTFFDKLDEALVPEDAAKPKRSSGRGPARLPPKLDKLLPGLQKSPEMRRRHRRFVDLWKVIAGLRVHGDTCSRPCVFEWYLRVLLETERHRGDLSRLAAAARPRDLVSQAWEAATRLYKDREKPARELKSDLPAFRHYLMTIDPPAWCRSVRYVAAAALVGEGDPAAMPVLLEGARLAFGKADLKAVSRRVLREAVQGAHTKKALPLWRGVMKDKAADKEIRDWAAAQVRRIKANND